MKSLILCLFQFIIFFSNAQVVLDPFFENPEVQELNRMPMRAAFFAFEKENIKKEDWQKSNRYIHLNGDWKLFYVNHYTQLPDPKQIHDDKRWFNFTVPGVLETNGKFGVPAFLSTGYEFVTTQTIPPDIPDAIEQPAALIKKSFKLNAEDLKHQLILHLGGIKSAYKVYINQQLVGAAKDSKLFAEFDIQKFVKEGENNIAIEIRRWSDASYLEAQSTWRITGVLQDCYIMAKPLTHIFNFSVQTNLINNYKDGEIVVFAEVWNNALPQPLAHKIKWILKDANDKQLAEQTKSLLFEKGKSGKTKILFKDVLTNVKAWSAEIPNLYKFQLQLIDSTGKLIENIDQKIGFKTVEIKNGQLLINGKFTYIKGVNRFETDPNQFILPSKEMMVKDIMEMKRMNVNAVRVGQSPADEMFYELCDEYGLYVIDEPNIQSVNAPQYAIGNDVQWEKAILQRVMRWYERDQNFTSIIGWSLGEDVNNGWNFYKAYEWLKKQSPNRPIFFNAGSDDWNSDAILINYPSFENLEALAKQKQDKPIIMGLYADATGNSLGGLAQYWNIISKYSKLQGGFINAWANQSVMKEFNGKRGWAYAGDFGEASFENDQLALANGLVSPERIWNPAAFEVKKVYQPIAFQLVDTLNKIVQVKNNYSFKTLDHIYLHWQLLLNGKVVQEDILLNLNVQPGATTAINIPFVMNDQGEYFLRINALMKVDEGIFKTKDLIAFEEFQLNTYTPQLYETGGEDITVIQKGDKVASSIKLSNSKFQAYFDVEEGGLVYFKVKNKKVFETAPFPLFYRPETDNELKKRLKEGKENVWLNATLNAQLLDIKLAVSPIPTGWITVIVRKSILDNNATIIQEYSFDGNGTLLLKTILKANRGNYPPLQKFGNYIALSNEYQNIEWYGRGEGENYPDRKSGAKIGLYKSHLKDWNFSYFRPQEAGNRGEVRWAKLTKKDGTGMLIVPKQGWINVSASVYDPFIYTTKSEKYLKKPSDLVKDKYIHLSIDGLQSGVGNWGRDGELISNQYALPYKDYQTEYFIIPLM